MLEQNTAVEAYPKIDIGCASRSVAIQRIVIRDLCNRSETDPNPNPYMIPILFSTTTAILNRCHFLRLIPRVSWAPYLTGNLDRQNRNIQFTEG